MPRSRHADPRRRRPAAGFTLIELIIVMLLLAIAAGMVAPRMSSFFRGRALNHEARRMLSLTHFAQSRAVSAGVPVLLWFDARTSTYGVEVQAGHVTDEEQAHVFTTDPSLTFTADTDANALVSEQEDEKLGLPADRAVIRFNPDGFFDEVSVRRIVLQQQDGPALELIQTENRLGYEIRSIEHAN